MNKYRFYEQAYDTLVNNECNNGDIINPFNKTVNKSGICPTLTTRPEGFKTAIFMQIFRCIRCKRRRRI